MRTFGSGLECGLQVSIFLRFYAGVDKPWPLFVSFVTVFTVRYLLVPVQRKRAHLFKGLRVEKGETNTPFRLWNGVGSSCMTQMDQSGCGIMNADSARFSRVSVVAVPAGKIVV